MEPVRPLVDRYVLRLLTERTFALTDFYETRQGVCRITPPLGRELASTIPEWRQAVGLVAEDVAKLLEDRPSGGRPTPTPVSGRNRSAGRGAVGRRRVVVRESRPVRACIWCGGPKPRERETCSSTCDDAVRAAGLEAFIEAGTRNLALHRRPGVYHPMTDDGKARMACRTTDLVRAAREWQRTHSWPPAWAHYEREVRPAVEESTVGELARATGLSRGYCGRVRRGEVVPHPMWWEAIAALGRKSGQSGTTFD
jgi:hypothetical protein